MAKLCQICCPKCNNKRYFNRYGKDAHGFQKYQCLNAGISGHQMRRKNSAADLLVQDERKNIRPAQSAGKRYTCTDRKCRHSVFTLQSPFYHAVGRPHFYYS